MISEEDIYTLVRNLSDRLRLKGLKCGFAESLTGGMISSFIVDIPGASDVFTGSVVSYTNDMKMRVLGVSAEVIDRFTEVSVQCAEQMAEGASAVTGADICVAVTGYAGGNNSCLSDVTKSDTLDGRVCIGFCSKNGSGALEKRFDGNRREVRLQTAYAALELVLKITEEYE